MSIHAVDPSRSRIVLIGTPHHTRADSGLLDLPEVANNLTDLAAVFTDPNLGGFDFEHCVTAPTNGSLPVMGDLLVEAARQAEDLLLVYYCGHGLLDRRGELHLALSETRADRPEWTAMPFETVRSACRDTRAPRRVVIVDSCLSGRARGRHLGSQDGLLRAQMEVFGGYTLTSSPDNGPALTLPGERNTAFTGRLLDLLRNGSPHAGEVLSMGDIYRHLYACLRAESLPEPQQLGSATADLIGLLRNQRAVQEPVSGPNSVGAVGGSFRAPSSAPLAGAGVRPPASERGRAREPTATLRQGKAGSAQASPPRRRSGPDGLPPHVAGTTTKVKTWWGLAVSLISLIVGMILGVVEGSVTTQGADSTQMHIALVFAGLLLVAPSAVLFSSTVCSVLRSRRNAQGTPVRSWTFVGALAVFAATPAAFGLVQTASASVADFGAFEPGQPLWDVQVHSLAVLTRWPVHGALFLISGAALTLAGSVIGYLIVRRSRGSS